MSRLWLKEQAKYRGKTIYFFLYKCTYTSSMYVGMYSVPTCACIPKCILNFFMNVTEIRQVSDILCKSRAVTCN